MEKRGPYETFSTGWLRVLAGGRTLPIARTIERTTEGATEQMTERTIQQTIDPRCRALASLAKIIASTRFDPLDD